MGLYRDNSAHSDVFLNRKNLDEPNQDYFETDYVADMVNEQKRMNHSLIHTCRSLQELYLKQQQTQKREWEEIKNELEQLNTSSREHAQFEQKAMESFHMLAKTDETLFQKLEEEGWQKQALMDEMRHIRENNQEVLDQIKDYESLNRNLTAKMDNLIELQQAVTEVLSKQHEDQYKTLQSLENQDALLEKILRQVTNLRSILFERSNFLAEKVENSYKLTSTFIYNAVSESDQPLAFRLDQKMAEHEQRKL